RTADISLAGAQLARLRWEGTPRRNRVYTGRVNGRRGWRGMWVILLNGCVGELLFAKRGAAAIRWRDEFSLRPDQYGACNANELKPFKSPAAVMLGSRKSGVKERPSAKKARSARLNGPRPPRPGSRPRGRPRTTP